MLIFHSRGVLQMIACFTSINTRETPGFEVLSCYRKHLTVNFLLDTSKCTQHQDRASSLPLSSTGKFHPIPLVLDCFSANGQLFLLGRTSKCALSSSIRFNTLWQTSSSRLISFKRKSKFYHPIISPSHRFQRNGLIQSPPP